MTLVYVFIGGGLGSLCRYALSQWLPWKAGTIPWGTFMANLLSCLVIGFLVSLLAKNQLSDSMKWMFITGFCGGFSTFSTFTYEVFELIKVGAWPVAFLYVLISVLLCLSGVMLGMKLSELI